MASRQSEANGRSQVHQNDLPGTVEMSISMKVMATTNVETDLNITNAALVISFARSQ